MQNHDFDMFNGWMKYMNMHYDFIDFYCLNDANDIWWIRFSCDWLTSLWCIKLDAGKNQALQWQKWEYHPREEFGMVTPNVPTWAITHSRPS